MPFRMVRRWRVRTLMLAIAVAALAAAYTRLAVNHSPEYWRLSRAHRRIAANFQAKARQQMTAAFRLPPGSAEQNRILRPALRNQFLAVHHSREGRWCAWAAFFPFLPVTTNPVTIQEESKQAHRQHLADPLRADEERRWVHEQYLEHLGRGAAPVAGGTAR